MATASSSEATSNYAAQSHKLGRNGVSPKTAESDNNHENDDLGITPIQLSRIRKKLLSE